MPQPSALPQWAVAANVGDVIEPLQSQKDLGWHIVAGKPQKPPYQYFNWWQKNVHDWVKWTRDNLVSGLENDLIPSGTHDIGATDNRWDDVFAQKISATQWVRSAAFDVELLGGTMNIGATNASIINIGRVGSTINFIGSLVDIIATNTVIVDKLITLNDDGPAASGGDSGIEIKENGIVTAYFKVSSNRNKWSFKAPNSTDVISIGGEAATVGDIGNVAGVFNARFNSYVFKNAAGSDIATISSAGILGVASSINAAGTIQAGGSVAAPVSGAYSAGDRFYVYAASGASHYSIGIESSNMWFNAGQSGGGFKFYGNGNATLLAGMTSGAILYSEGAIWAKNGTFYGQGQAAQFRVLNVNEFHLYPETAANQTWHVGYRGYAAGSTYKRNVRFWNAVLDIGGYDIDGYWALGDGSPSFKITKISGSIPAYTSSYALTLLPITPRDRIKSIIGKVRNYSVPGIIYDGANSVHCQVDFSGNYVVVSFRNASLALNGTNPAAMAYDLYIIYEST